MHCSKKSWPCRKLFGSINRKRTDTNIKMSQDEKRHKNFRAFKKNHKTKRIQMSRPHKGAQL